MHWNAAIERNHEAVRRVAARLLALAILAEHAAGRSRPVRCLVLWLLRRAETAARAFAAEVGWAASPPVSVACAALGSSDDPGDAVRLAQQFRALAAAFYALSHQALLYARRWTGFARQCHPGALTGCSPDTDFHARAAHRPRCPDTS